MEEKTILIVEDEPDITMLVKRSLSSKSYKLLEANSGTNALELLKTANPDLILLDIMMPDMDGFEVCRRIKSNPDCQHIPVVFLTVRNNQEDMDKGKEIGAAGYFTKPFDPIKLSEEIGKLLS